MRRRDPPADQNAYPFFKHLAEVDFYPELKALWLSHLTYCYHLFIASTPPDCSPALDIG